MNNYSSESIIIVNTIALMACLVMIAKSLVDREYGFTIMFSMNLLTCSVVILSEMKK